MKQCSFLPLLFFLLSCSGEDMSVDYAKVTIRPYTESDRGRMWEVCVGSKNKSRDPYIFIKIKYIDGHEYDCSLKYDWTLCKTMNVLVSLTHRHTPHSEWEYLRSSDGKDIKYILVQVKEDYDDQEFIYENTIKPISI